MKKTVILLMPFFLLLIFCTCTDEMKSKGKLSAEKEVEISFTTSGLLQTKTVTDETINTVDVLVFERDGAIVPGDAKLLYSRYAWKKSGNTYSAVLKRGENLDLYFAVNVHELIQELGLEKPTQEWTLDEVRQMLVLDDFTMEFINPHSGTGLPMWGCVYNQTIADVPINRLGAPVRLLRAVAAIDVLFTAEASAQFRLDYGKVGFAADKGYLAFNPDNMMPQFPAYPGNIAGGFQAAQADVPSDMSLSITQGYSPTSPGKIEKLIYIYENDAPVNTARRSTKLILSGVYNPGQSTKTTYYPLSLRAQKDGELVKSQVKRNTKFFIKITKVNGEGYDTEEEAVEGEDLNMEYEIIEWNEQSDGNLMIDGAHYISLGADRNEKRIDKTAVLYRNTGSDDVIRFTHDKELPEITMTLSGTALPDPNGTLVQNDRFEIKLVREDDQNGYFLFTALKDYGQGATNDHEAILTVTAGRIQFTISLLQRNTEPNDWHDGGDIPIDFTPGN